MSEAESANNGVYLLSLELENVRCFGKKQKLDLSDGKGNYAKWTVILGDNGTGKTTLLESIFLKSFASYEGFTKKGEIEGGIHRYYDNGRRFEIATLSDVSVYNKLSENRLAPYLGNDIHLINIFSYNAERKSVYTKNTIGNDNDVVNAKYDLLTNAETWLKDTYLFSEAKSQFKERFNSVKKTLVDLLPDVTEIDIYYPDENKPELKVRFLANGVWLSLDALSLGYQSMIAWIVDLAARLFKAYPNSKNPIAEPAVVLIDEIDLHLHPKWQREIMRYLSERFINTQFIVTAHSPLIVQAAEDENANIVVLQRKGDEVEIKQDFKAFHGWRVDQLLASDLFDNQPSRSSQHEKWMEERRKILGQSHLTEADEQRLTELKEKIGYIPMAESPEDIEAMELIRETAQLLKDKYKQ